MISNNLLELLETEKPLFHLKSLTDEVPNAEDFFYQKGKTETQDLPRTSYGIGTDVLDYISSIVKPNFLTLETGCGNSTVLFAANAKKHICVNPDITSNQLVKNWLLNHNCSCDNLEFIEESSDRGLAKLTLSEPVDVALIDGSHSFPIPMIDWHFIDLFLRAGSKLLIDNTEINSVKILSEYLLQDSSYKQIAELNRAGKCVVFEKINDTRVMGWLNQEINKKPLMWFSKPETPKASSPLKRLLNKFGIQ